MPLPKIDYSTLDFTGVKEEDLTKNENFQTMEIGEKRKFIKALTNFNKFDEQTSDTFNAIVEADHIGFNSSGASRVKHFSEAESIRSALRETETLKSTGELTDQKRADINKKLTSQLMGINKDFREAPAKQAELRDAVLNFEKASRGVHENSKSIGGDKELLKEARNDLNRHKEVLKRNGIEPTEEKGAFEDIGSRGLVIKDEDSGIFAKGKFLTDEFKAAKADAEAFNSFKGEPVFKDRNDEFIVRPHAVLSDPSGINDIIEASDAPRLTKQKLIKQADNIKQNAPVEFLQDLAGLGKDREELGDTLLSKFNGELSNRGLNESSMPSSEIISNYISDKTGDKQSGVVNIFTDDELSILDDIVLGEVSQFAQEEQDKSRLRRLGEVATKGLITGSENVALVGVNAVNFASPEDGSVNNVTDDILDAVNDKRQSAGNLDQLRSNDGLDFTITSAITQEVPALLVTRGLGQIAGGAKTGTRVATAFGVSREALSSIEEMRREGRGKEEQLRAGLLTGITSYITTQAFNKLGAGGVENFDDAAKEGLKSGITKILKDSLGEGSEEFIQTLSQNAILNSERHWNDKQAFAESMDEAMIAFLVGGIMGGFPSVANVIADNRTFSTVGKSNQELQQVADVLLQKNEKSVANNPINAEASTDGGSRDLTTDNRQTKIQDEPTPDIREDRGDIENEIPETNTEEVSDQVVADPQLDETTSTSDIQQQPQTTEETSDPTGNELDSSPSSSEPNDVDTDSQPELSPTDDTQTISNDVDSTPESSGGNNPAASTEVAQEESSGSQESAPLSDNIDEAKQQVVQEIISTAKNGNITKDEAVALGKRLEQVDNVDEVQKVSDNLKSLNIEPTSDSDIETSDNDLSPAEQSFKDRVINNVTAKGGNATRAVSSSTLFATNPAREVEITNDAIIESLGSEQSGQIISKIQNIESDTGVNLNEQIDITVGKRQDRDKIDKSQLSDLVQTRLLKSIHNKIKNGQSVDEAVQSTLVRDGKTRDNVILRAIKTIRENQERSKTADELNRNTLDTPVESSRKASQSSQIKGAKIVASSAVKQRAFIDSGAMGHVSSQLKKGETVSVVDVDQPALSKVVKSVSSLFGAKVVFYQTNNPDSNADDGFTLAGDNTIYINVDSSRSVDQIIGHEAAHVLQTENTELFNSLMDSLIKNGIINEASDVYKNFLKKRGYQTNNYDQQFYKEFTADVIGRIFEDATHLDKFRSDVNNDKAFKRFTNALLMFVNKLKLKLRDLVSDLLPNANGQMFNTVNDSLRATYILHEALSGAAHSNGVPSYNNEAHNNTFRLTTLQNQAEGFVNPQAQSFMDLTDVNSSKPVKGKKSKKKTINQGKETSADFKKFVAEANPLKDTAVSEIKKMAEERGWVEGDTPTSNIESIVRNFSGVSARNAKNVKELVSRIKENYQGQYDLNDSVDGDVIAAVGIKLAMIDNLRDEPNSDRKEELFSAIAASDVVINRGANVTSLNEQIRLSGQVLSVLGNLGADAEGSGYRYFAGLSVSASLGLKKNNINTLGENDHKKIVDSLNDDNDQTRILALMEENSRISETLSSSLGALKRQREANKKLVDRLIKQIEQFRGVVSSSAKNNAENRLDAVLAQLHQVAVINSETDINDIETLVDDANKTVDILDNIDFDFLTKNPKFKRSAEAVRQSNDEAKNTLDQVNEDTHGEAEENAGDYFLSSKIFGFKKSIKNAIKNRDVSEHQRIYGIESTKFKIGESTLEQAVADISASEPFAEASIDKITEALKQDLKTVELLAKESSLQKGKRKIYEAQKRQIQARKDKPKAVKKYSPADTLSKLNKGTLTLDEAIVEIRSNIDSVIDEHVEAYLLEGIKTSNKRAKARLQSSVDRHIGESVHGSVLKLARSLGVSSFKSQQIGVKSWSDMSSLEKIKAVKDSEFIPKSAESKSSIDAIVAKLDTIDGQSSLDTESSIDALESVNTTIKESKTPPSSSLSNWLKTKIQEDPLFWHELPSKKLDVIREYFEQGRNDPEMAGVFSELVDGKVTDTSLNRLAEVSMKRLEKAAKQLADQKAERLKDQLENSRFSVAELSEGIMMGLFDKTVSRDAIVSNMLGLDFKISNKGIAQIAANRKIIETMIADGVPDPYNTDAGIKALKDIKRVLTRELKDFNGSIWDTLMSADTASILASQMTVIALPALSSFSLASSIIKQFMQVVWNNKNNPNFSKADRLSLLKENFTDAFNLKDISAASINGLMHGSHALGDSNLQSKSHDSLDAHISILDARLQKLEFSRNKLAEMNSENVKIDSERLNQYSIVMRDVLLLLPAATTSIFNVMQGVTEIFAEPARKLNLAMEAQEQILQGELTLKQYRALRQASSDKAKSSLAVIESVAPDIPWYSKRVQVNHVLHQEIFQAYVQDFGIEEAMHSMHSAHLTAVGISGDTNESIGPIGVVTKDISNFLGKPLTKEERNLFGYASKSARFTAGIFFKFFGSASHSLDAALYNTPIGYTMTLALNKGWINSEHHTGFRKRLAEAVENYNRTGRSRKERFQDMLIGLPVIVGYIAQAFLVEDEEERLFHIDLSYPDRTKEQVEFMEESDRREYKLYINTPQGRLGLDLGRGAAPQLLGNLIIAERVVRAVNRSEEDGLFGAVAVESVNLGFDAVSLGSPFIDSIITEVQRRGDGGSGRRLTAKAKKNIARFIDVTPSGFANDVDKIRFGRRSLSDDAPLLAYMPSMQLFNQFSEYKGKRLDQRGQPVDGQGFWNAMSAINSPITFRSDDSELLSGDMKKAYDIRNSVNYGRGSRSDYAVWSRGFFGNNVPLNVKNAYAVSRGYKDSQEMHEVAILTRTKMADRATVKLGSSKALKQHALNMKNPTGDTSQARVVSRKRSEEKATAILSSPYSDANDVINGTKKFRDHKGKIRKGLNKKAFEKFNESYTP